MTWKEIKDKNLLQVKTSKINNTINIEKILKYLILFFYVSINKNNYNNNLYRKKLKNSNNSRLISPIGSDSITIFPVKILLFQLD